jgi:DNA-binding beta-propeller fold protein YncE
VDPRDGSIFVADAWNRRIQKLDPNLVPLAEWPVSSWGSEHLYYKPYITVAGNGDVYASDPENFRVIVYNSAGGIKAGFGSFGSEPSRFGLPNGLAWDATTNTVVVADADNQRLLDFAVLP